MLGGVITGGTTVASDTLYSQGGALAGIMSSATIEILGGTIMNCSSASDGGSIYSVGKTVLKDCRILGGAAQGNGGNICQNGGTLIMENCEIAYGTAYGSAGGGNIYTNKATVTDSGSTIRDGYAAGTTGSSGGGNLYYSGCRFQWHYEWWRDGKSNYQLFVTDNTGRHMTEGVSLEYGLSQYNWDFIGTLETSSYIRYSSNDAQKHYNKIKKYLDEVIPYVQSEFPLAKMYYQEGWSNQIGYDGNGYQVNSVADQEHDMSLYRSLSSLICPTYGLERVNLGEAWQEYRAVANASTTDGLEDTLCARLGKTVSGTPHEGDFAHDGDIAGGQLLNACVWYEILTGLDCRENDYSPVYTYGGKTYTLSDELVTALKEAAHKAVSQR